MTMFWRKFLVRYGVYCIVLDEFRPFLNAYPSDFLYSVLIKVIPMLFLVMIDFSIAQHEFKTPRIAQLVNFIWGRFPAEMRLW